MKRDINVIGRNVTTPCVGMPVVYPRLPTERASVRGLLWRLRA